MALLSTLFVAMYTTKASGMFLGHMGFSVKKYFSGKTVRQGVFSKIR